MNFIRLYSKWQYKDIKKAVYAIILCFLPCLLTLFLSGFITNTYAATIISSEYFIDTDPGEGMGTPIPLPIDGAYDSVKEEVQFTINTSTLKIGSHTVYMRMKNSDGDWGVARPIANDMEFATPYNLTVEGSKIITAAEYFFDTDPGLGNGTPITAPADGTFDESVEALELSGINTSGLSVGLHTVYIRSKDNNGDWGVVREYTFEVRSPNVISGGKFAVDYDPILEESTLVDDFSAGETWTENQGTGSANNGVYSFALTGMTDPYFWKNITDFEESLKYLVITYRSYTNGPGSIQLFYTDGVDCTAWNSICAQTFPIIQDGAWHTLTVEVTDPEWTDNDGIITQLRFDLEGASALGTFSVDDIRFSSQRLSQVITPVDGAFDEGIESGTGSINTGELPGGGHTIYLRMRDATGWGPLVTYSLGVSTPMVQFISQPKQTPGSGGQVPFNVWVEDYAGSDTYRMKVEYSTDNVTWKKATLSGSLVDNGQDFQVGPIATSGGGVSLSLTWRSGTDLSNQEHSSAALRLILDNFAGRVAQTASGGFVLDNKAPIVPALMSPADNIETKDPTPLFIWHGVEEGAVYRLQVDNHSDFSSPIIDQSLLSGNVYAVLTPAPPAQYFWRVKATDGMGNQSAFSPASDFKILSDTTPPAVAVSYSNNPAAAGTLLITATFSEPIDTLPTIKVDQPGTVDDGPVSMNGSGDVWTYAYEVHKASAPDYIDGAAKVTISNAKDAAGNTNQPATNDTFEINTSQPAGTITAAEYFIDTDPGEGLGSPIPTPVDGAYDSAKEDVQFTINTSTLKIGSHTVYVRMKNSDGAWGIARPIANDMEFATPYNLTVEGNKIITAAEYFFDTDPGLGNGTPITAPADGAYDSGTEYLESASFNLNDLSKGLHTLYLRAKDINGDWGPAREYTFEVRGPSGGIITASEYYIDVDPGPGNGTLLKVNDGAFDEVTEQMHTYLNTTGVSEGLHEVCVRAHSSGGEWSSNYCENLTVGVTTTCLPLSGVLRDEITRKPLANITVNIDGGAYSTKTDQNGFYNLPCISTGKHVVTVVVPTGYVSYSRTIDIPLNSIWDIKLTRSETVNGTDTDSGYSKDPVNTATGNYTYQHNDIGIPGIGIPFTFERAYNSLSPMDGPLGFGWTHNYIITLTINDDGAVTIRWGDGRTETWTPEVGGGFKPQYGVFDTLIDNKNGTYTLRKKDLTRFNFDTSGRLSSIADKNGNKINLNYTTKGLTRITDTAGRIITINYDSKDHITIITDPIGRTITFVYNPKGDLISATDMNNNPTQYTYDVNHQMLSAVDPRGNTIVSNVYDNQKRVVVSQKDAKQGETKYTYEEVDKKTIILDALGNKTTHYHDELLRLIQEQDAKGNSTYYAYNEAGNRIRVRDKNGNITKYSYDGKGNVTSKTDALNIVTTITYDASNNPLTRTEAVGTPLQRTTTFEYDAKGNLLKTTDPLGNFTTITYEAHGLPLTITDPKGNTTTNTYDPAGNLAEVTNALGKKTTYTYDGVGRRLTTTDALLRTTTYTYDNNSNLLTVTDPIGTMIYTYDKNNNKESVKDKKGKTTQYAYDVKDLLQTITDPYNKTITYTYDPLDRRTSVTDKNGNAAAYTYDPVGNLTEVTDPYGKKTTYSYDANGNKLTETDPQGHITTYKYDVLNRVTEVKDPLGNTTITNYDALDRVSSTINAKLQTTYFEYDALGRLTKVTDANSGTVQYTYDTNGNRLTMVDPNANTTGYEYDAMNRLTRKIEPYGQHEYGYDDVGNMTSKKDPKGNTLVYQYDALNRLEKITYPDTTFVSYAYDANNNRISMTDNLGTSIYTYDDLNRMTSYTDPFGKIAGYGYDDNGNRTSLIYPDGKVVQYSYDKRDRLETVTDWLGKITTYSYDDAGNLSDILNPNNTKAAFTYDIADRLTGILNTKSDSTVISSYSYTLDVIGNHENVSQDEPLIPLIPAQNVAYTHDAENRMTDAGGVTNTFDTNGNMTAKGSDTFTYDYNDRLVESSIGGVVTQYRYDGVGNRLARVTGVTTTRYVQDINGGLSNVIAETDAAGTITAYYVHGLGLISKVLPDGTAYYYHYDSRGSTIALSDAGENITDAYAYDPFGNVVNLFGVTVNPFRYVGMYGVQDEGNGLAYIRARYYVPELGRFITKDPQTGKDGDTQSLNRYVYAVNNPVRFVDVSGLSPREGNKIIDNFGTSDNEHRELIERKRKSYAAINKNLQDIAKFEGEGFYWEAVGKFAEAAGEASGGIGSALTGDFIGAGTSIIRLTNTLIEELGYADSDLQKTTNFMADLIDTGNVVAGGVKAIKGVPRILNNSLPRVKDLVKYTWSYDLPGFYNDTISFIGFGIYDLYLK